MKSAVRMFLVAMLVVAFGGCEGGSKVTNPDEPILLNEVRAEGGNVTFTFFQLDGRVYHLSCEGKRTESRPASDFTEFVMEGDKIGWNNYNHALKVAYNGTADVTVQGVPSGDFVNGYLLSKTGEHCWVDLGMTYSNGGCEVVFQKQYDRHVVHLL